MKTIKEYVPEVNPEKLRYCFHFGSSAADGKVPGFQYKTVIGTTAVGEKVMFADNPVNRFLQAVVDSCDTREEAKNYAYRLMALLNLLDKMPDDLLRKRDGGIEFNEVILLVAASFPCCHMEFDRRKFIKEARRVRDEGSKIERQG